MSFERPRVVFAYDFDGTLAPGNMQEHAFIPDELGMDHQDFWAETKALARDQRGDPILAYMHLMLEKARARNVLLTLDSWRQRGANLPLFPGKSFMNGDHKWAFYGACLAFGGFVLMGFAQRQGPRRD